ncbi:hypothetical protein HAX54_018675 [Datura stramonium]|uniref:Pentatricopeptide repeat-containing protein n=1 Tax=Datura stramonium TaxID=4076 RepID=A0ABS8UQ55_DATST|nr:hypothetical protein [Datura stramonium]
MHPFGQHFHSYATSMPIFSQIRFSYPVYVATSLLNAYIGTSFEYACKLFDEIPVRNTVTWNTMITCFSRSGNVERARKMFDDMPLRDLVSWSAMIAGYMNSGHWEEGVALFREMVILKQLKPDQVTIGPVLAGCSKWVQLGCFLGNQCTVLQNMVTWTALICGAAKNGFGTEALEIFKKMRQGDVLPNEFTFTGVLSACVRAGLIDERC